VSLMIFCVKPTAARADVINIDFQPDEGAPPVMHGQAGYPGDAGLWNDINDNNTGLNAGPGHDHPVALFNSAGLPTNATIRVTGAGGFNDQGIQSLVAQPTDLMRDYVYDGAFTGQVGTYTLAGLVPGNTYDLYLYGSNATFNSGALFTIGNVSEGTNGSQVANRSLIQGDDFVVFAGVSADVNGQIVITHGNNPAHSNGTTPLNGLQLIGAISVPEPSSLVLALIAAAGVIMAVAEGRET